MAENDTLISGSPFLGATGAPVPVPPKEQTPPPVPPSATGATTVPDIIARMSPDQRYFYDLQMQAEREEAARRQAAAGAEAGAASRRAADLREYLATPKPSIYEPKYKATPTPPKPQYRDPMEAIGNPLAGLALIAGLFTRNSGTATLKAAAAAMQAQQKGDQIGYENARNEFRDKLDETMRNNEQERTAYLDSWNNRKLTMQEKLSELEMKATLYRNEAMAAAARSGNVSQAQMQLNALIKSKQVLDNIAPIAKTTGEWQAQEAQRTIARLKSEHPDWNEEKVYSEANRVLKPIFEVTQKPNAAAAAILDTTQHPELQGLEGKAYLDKLKQVNPAVAATIDSIVRGDTPYPTRSDANSQAIRNAVNLADPTYSSATAGIIARTKQNYADNRTATAPGGQITAGNTVVRHIARLEEAAKQLRNTKTRTLNLARAKFGQLTQFPELAAMQADSRAVTGEIDRFLTAKAPTVTGMKEWSGIINGTATPDEIEAVAKALRNLAQDRFVELGDSYNRGVLAVDPEGRPDQQNPRFKPWTFWINEPWREIVKGGGAAGPPASGLPDANAIDEELKRRGG